MAQNTSRGSNYYIIDESQEAGKIPREYQELLSSVLLREFTVLYESVPEEVKDEVLLLEGHYDEDKFCFRVKSAIIVEKLKRIVDSLSSLWPDATLRVISKTTYNEDNILVYLVVDDNSLCGSITQANHNKIRDAFLKNTTYAQRRELFKHVWEAENINDTSYIYVKTKDCIEELQNRIAALPQLWDGAKLRLVDANEYDATETLPPNVSVMYFIDRNRVGGHFPREHRGNFEWNIYKAIMDFMNSDENRPALGFIGIRNVEGDLCMFYDTRTADCLGDMCLFMKNVPCPWPNGSLRLVEKDRYQYLQRRELKAMRSLSRLKKETFLRTVNYYIVNEKRTDGKFPRAKFQLLERALGDAIAALVRASKAEGPPLRIPKSRFINGVYGLFIESSADRIRNAVEQMSCGWTDEKPRLITRAHRMRMAKKLWNRAHKIENKNVFVIVDKSEIFGKISKQHQALLKTCLANASQNYAMRVGPPESRTHIQFVNDSLEVYPEGANDEKRIREILATMACPWESAELCLLPLGETEKYHIISVKLAKTLPECCPAYRAGFYKQRLGFQSDYGLETHRWWLLQELELENNLLFFKWCIDAVSHEYIVNMGKVIVWNDDLVEVKYHKL